MNKFKNKNNHHFILPDTEFGVVAITLTVTTVAGATATWTGPGHMSLPTNYKQHKQHELCCEFNPETVLTAELLHLFKTVIECRIYLI